IKKLSIACLGATTIALAINKPASASVFFNSDTGHYYEYVPGEYTWNQAKASAETRSYNGWQRYLITITSEAENNFIISNIGIPTEHFSAQAGGWLGANDTATEGTWQWVTSPEAGTVFWQNGTPNHLERIRLQETPWRRLKP
ncbi:MAG: hypothetical protein F6K34_18100, partial [Okeania sp. SIO4D6]|nr:hypothetical protein [Okeania sp. SIO4D6]